MPIVQITSDPVAFTLTVVGEYPVPVERLWAAWADPRQLERFWGPPTWPAAFERHDMSAGGRSAYAMVGPDGQRSRGSWEFVRVEAPRRIEVLDRFCREDGSDDPAMPTTHMDLRFEPAPGGSRFVGVSTFPSLEAMEKLVAMGMVEGMRAALGQLDGVLAGPPSAAC